MIPPINLCNQSSVDLKGLLEDLCQASVLILCLDSNLPELIPESLP